MNPAFPLVSSEDDVRQAIFELLRGEDRFEIVDADGQAFNISGPTDLALGSKSQFLRKAGPVATAREQTPMTPLGGDNNLGPLATGGPSPIPNTVPATSGVTTPAGGTSAEVRYRQYVLTLPNRSLVDEKRRDAVFKLLGALSDKLDPTSGVDLQLVDVNITVTAAEGSLADLKERAAQAEAKWEDREEDLLA
ncbi:MAG: hypothetical protein ACYC4J_02125 [Gemmatimonadaceae bacterium]